MSCPRPILKRNPDSAPSTSSTTSSLRPSNHERARTHCAVHFPPSPTLTRTFAVHSAASYDRSPIVVGPNSCALPERGCPGRTYTLEGGEDRRPARTGRPEHTGRHLHPRSLGRQNDISIGDELPSNMPPPLVPDLSSSESDESDGVLSPPIPMSRDLDRKVFIAEVPKQRKHISRRRDDGDTRARYRPLADHSLKPCNPLALPDEGCFGGF